VESLLDELGFPEALGRDPIDGHALEASEQGENTDFTQPELFFGSGATIARMRLANMRFSGVETMLPSLGYLDVVPKTHYGPRGALQLIESVLNGLLF
jgi:hypothetical protein